MEFSTFLDRDDSYSEEEIVPTSEYPTIIEKPETEYKTNIKFTDLLVISKPYEYKLKKYKFRKTAIDSINFEVDDQTRFRYSMAFAKTETPTVSCLSFNKNAALRRHLKKKQIEKEEKEPPQAFVEYPFDVIDWEENILYEAPPETKKVGDPLIKELVNEILEEEDWEEQVVYDDKNKFKNYLTLRINDPNLIFERIEDKRKKNKKRAKEVFISDKPLKGKYNISNDKYYSTESATKSSLGTLGVQHSVPALKLHSKFYKTFLSKEELRSFHRPAFSFPKSIKFSSLKDDEFNSSNVIKRVNELTLSDGSQFSLFEYSEEIPLFVLNPGMVSLLTLFYRKNNGRDEFMAPEHTHVSILDPEDPSPFYGFGDVKAGCTLLALTNNLFKVPIFQHSSKDFICISEDKNFYIRKIDSVYVTGQEMPLEEVFSPHSRKHNLFCKNRLKVAAYRIFYKKENKEKILRINQLDDLFPHFSEGSKRKWLKEYADCIKKGKDNIWVLKASSSILNEEDLRKLVTPEHICQYESMLAGERRLKDGGFELHGGEEDEDDSEEEIALSPWNLSRNFVNACNGRGLLELKGEGDPTGIGEGFSFLKVQQKKGNELENRKMMNELQAQYKEEIEKIWNKQIESLKSDREIIFEIKEDEKEKERRPLLTPKIAETPSENMPFIIIKRTFLKNNEKVVEEERVYDQRIIKAYLKARKEIKIEEKKSGMKCGSCGQIGHMKTNKTCPNFPEVRKLSKRKREDVKRKANMFLVDIILQSISVLFNVPYSSAFHRPVSTKKFPDYKNFVSEPIDLNTMKSKARQRKYPTYDSFIQDLKLMKQNCVKYNGPEHSLTKIADNMIIKAEEIYDSKKDEINEAEKNVNGAEGG